MATGDPIQIGSDLLLVHEGKGDLNVLGALMRHAGIEGFQTLPLNGQQKIRGFFKALGASPHFKAAVPDYGHPVRSLAIVLDAEQDVTATFRRVCDALSSAGLPAPAALGESSAGSPRVGVFLVPDNQSAGKIETLCLRSVEDDPAWSCLDVFFDCVRQRGGALPENIDKARAQAFLSTRPQPDRSVGHAALEGYWRFESPAFASLIAFLRELATPLAPRN